MRLSGAVLLLLCSSEALAGETTDFGIRLVRESSREVRLVAPRLESPTRPLIQPFVSRPTGRANLSGAVAIASGLGRVTSTFRSHAHNRFVGGVRNSFHLSGRALDVVPRRGLRHRDIEAALLSAGYRLRESLDEGDHSHFAFDFDGGPRATYARAQPQPAVAATPWKVVYAPRAGR